MHKKDGKPDVDERRRAFVRPSTRVPAGPQIAALIEAGAGAVYVLGRHRPLHEQDGARIYTHTDAADVWLRSLDASCVALVTTVGRLGASRQEIAAVVRRIHKAGSVVEETTTGRRSDDPAVLPEMMMDAADELSGVRRGRFTSKTGAAARALQEPIDRLALSRAKAVWADLVAYPTTADALAAMPGWTYRTAFHKLGPRDPKNPRRGGRPRKTVPRKRR